MTDDNNNGQNVGQNTQEQKAAADYENWQKKWAEEQAESRKILAAKLQLAANICKELGIVGITVEYSGSGDSGGVDYAWVLAKIPENVEKLFSISTEDINEIEDEEGKEKLTSMPVPAEFEAKTSDDFFAFLSDLIYETTPDGYEINDGGAGVAMLNCQTGEVELHHGTYYTECGYETYTFNKE